VEKGGIAEEGEGKRDEDEEGRGEERGGRRGKELKEKKDRK
jgi:hypothetical protein